MRREFEDACRRVALALANAHKDGTFSSVVFAGSWPNEGTSIVVKHVAAHLTDKHGLRVRVLDLDGGALVPRKRENEDESSRSGSVLSLGQANGLSTSAAVLNRVREQSASHSPVEEALALLGVEYDFLIVDAPPLMESGAGLEAGALIPRLVLVVRAGRTQTGTLEQVRAQLRTFNIHLVASVLTRYKTYIPRFLDRWLTQ